MSNVASRLSELFISRAPKREIMRGTLGNGQGQVLYPALDDYVWVRLRGSQNQLVSARNLQVPNINNLYVDVERIREANNFQYRVIGLTEALTFPAGEQPIANAVLHAYTHLPTGYDPIGFAVRVTNVTADYAMIASDTYIGVDTTAAHTVTLLDASLVPVGKAVLIHDESGTGGATHNITVSGNIEGSGSMLITTNRGSLMVISNGRTWAAPIHI
jgi:hypothetical protein